MSLYYFTYLSINISLHFLFLDILHFHSEKLIACPLPHIYDILYASSGFQASKVGFSSAVVFLVYLTYFILTCLMASFVFTRYPVLRFWLSLPYRLGLRSSII